MILKNKKSTAVILGVILMALTYGSFSTILENDFISLDDHTYITKNPNIVGGLTLDSVKWAFQTMENGNWIPLSNLSHMLDIELYGLNPGKHHLTSLIFHCFNALLVFLLFYKMTDSLWASFLTALLFAIHPLRTESVAWVSERKDVLSTFFGLLSLLAYVIFAKNKRVSAYFLTAVFLILGLMSKSMLVTWPFVLLLLDYWPLKRFLSNSEKSLNIRFSQKTLRQLLIEKIPFLGIVLIFCLIAFLSQRTVGAVLKSGNYPLSFRIENALNSYVAYIKLTFFPHGLGVFYPLISRHFTLANLLLCSSLLSGLTVLFFCLRKQKPYLLVGWLWYLGTLVPVIGLVQIGRQAMADRYTYIPGIGIAVMVAFLINDFSRRGRLTRIFLSVGMSLVISVFIFLTLIQSSYWKDSLTLYRHTLEVTENNYTMHMDFGYALANAKMFDDALTQFQQAHEIMPVLAEPLQKMGRVCMDTGRYEQAAEYFKQAINKEKSDQEMIYFNLGTCYTRLNQHDLAVSAYQKVLTYNAANINAVVSLANTYHNSHDYTKSLDYFKEALTLDPNSALVLNNLALFYIDKESTLYNPQKALEYSSRACLATDFNDKETLAILIHILEQEQSLRDLLDKAFLDKLNQRTSELKSSSTQK